VAKRVGVVISVAVFLALAVAPPLAAQAQWPETFSPQRPPNDGDFAPCEYASTYSDPGMAFNCYSTGGNNYDQFDMYGALSDAQYPCPGGLPHPDGGLPCWSTSAFDPNHMAGVNFTGAWANGNIGRDDVIVAYIEGGTNYSSDGVKDSLDNQWLNKGELPCPERANGTSLTWPNCYDLDGNRRLDLRDYIHDPRVNPPCPAGVKSDTPASQGGGLNIDVEATSWNCVAGGQHQYLNAVNVNSKRTPYLSPEDLVAVFGHCQIAKGQILQCPAGGRFDNDGNGYPNDIAGWNFERNNNDPQTEDLAYGHAPGLNSLVAGAADNNYGSVGLCPTCRVVNIKQGAECLGRSDKWAEAILYAADIGASAVSAVVVNYTYSKFIQDAINYAYNKGVLLSLDSNDFDAMDHTDGMLWDHVFPGNSAAMDAEGEATHWFRARSNITSYGTHNLFSGGEYTTSGATPFMASVLAMTQAAALNARDKGIIPSRLTPNEVKQILTDTAQAIIPNDVPQPLGPGAPAGTLQPQWPGNPLSNTDADHTNWSTQYGYGRPDVGAATAMIMAGQIPPTADITGPQWYSYVDPTVQPSLPITGSFAQSRLRSGGSVSYTLEWALGADPADATFHTAAQGTIRGGKTGTLGVIDLSQVPSVFYTHPAATTLQPDGAEQYTMTIRLRVKDANGLKAEDRRSVGLHHDPDLAPGYPKSVNRADGDAAPTYADLEGKHELDLIVPNGNGEVNVWRPDGTEVTGFPTHTSMLKDIDPLEPQNYPAPAYKDATLKEVRDPISGGAGVGDLFHNGELEITATTTNGYLYAWTSHGQLLPGFPVHQSAANWQPYTAVPTPRAPTGHSRNPDRGNWSPPVLADLEGTGKLDSIMTAFDGHVYAWRPDGTPVPGWPVEIKLADAPGNIFKRDGVDPGRYIRDAKLMYPVSVADVEKVGHPQVFVPSFESNGVSTSTDNLAKALLGLEQDPGSGTATTWLYGIWADGNNHPGGPYLSTSSTPSLPSWPVQVKSSSFTYDQSIDFVGESTSPPSIGDVDGSGTLRLITGAITGTVYAFNPDGSVYSKLSATCASADCTALPPYRTGDTHTVTLTGEGALGDLTGTGTPQFIMNNTGLESIVASLDVPGVANLPQVYERAWNVATGQGLPGWPKRVDGFPFYASPITADVAGLGLGRSAIEGNDTYWIHAFQAGGAEAPGFPKYTGQWQAFSGVVGDPLMNGQLHYVTPTREGFVFNWNVSGDTSLNNSWWHYRHDEHNTGSYGVDTRRPASILDLKASGTGPFKLAWTAPGDDYMVGAADHYDVRWSTAPITDAGYWSATPLNGAPSPAAAGTSQTMDASGVSGTAVYFAARAIDKAGNIGALSNVVCAGNCKRTAASPAGALASSSPIPAVARLAGLSSAATSSPQRLAAVVLEGAVLLALAAGLAAFLLRRGRAAG